MKVLWVTAAVPYPAGAAGDTPETALLTEAAAKHDLRIVALDLPSGERMIELAGRTVPAHGVDWRPRAFLFRGRPMRKLQDAAQFLFDAEPYEQAQMGDAAKSAGEVVDQVLADHPADLIHVSGAELIPAAVGRGVPVAALVAPTQGSILGPAGSLRRRIDEGKSARWRRRTLAKVAAWRQIGEMGPGSLEALWDEAMRSGTVAGRVRGSPGRPAREAAPPRSVSIVIPTANRTELLREALPTVVAAAALLPGTELVIVEEGATGAAELVRELGIDATVIHEGVGAAQKRNIGVTHARGDVVLFTDDDCTVPPSWVVEHVKALADPEVTATFGGVGGLSRTTGEDPVSLPLRHRPGAAPWHLGHTSNMGVRRAALLAVGGFDERLGPGTTLGGGEDHDLFARLASVGGVMLTGVGDPVSHADWRGDEDHAKNLRAYETGAGLWIGKALREQGRPARRFVRARWRLLRDRWLRAGEGERKEVLVHLALLGRGIVTGYRMAGRRHPHRWIGDD